jgi:hypothetical protein
VRSWWAAARPSSKSAALRHCYTVLRAPRPPHSLRNTRTPAAHLGTRGGARLARGRRRPAARKSRSCGARARGARASRGASPSRSLAIAHDAPPRCGTVVTGSRDAPSGHGMWSRDHGMVTGCAPMRDCSHGIRSDCTRTMAEARPGGGDGAMLLHPNEPSRRFPLHPSRLLRTAYETASQDSLDPYVVPRSWLALTYGPCPCQDVLRSWPSAPRTGRVPAGGHSYQ